MVWRTPRERHERKNTATAIVVVVIVVAWLVGTIADWLN